MLTEVWEEAGEGEDKGAVLTNRVSLRQDVAYFPMLYNTNDVFNDVVISNGSVFKL